VNDDHDDQIEEFLVTLGGGGGPVPFHQALARKFRELALWRSYCAILSPFDRPLHYVQAMVTGAGVRVESVGSRYLQEADEDDLTADQVATLEALGWLAPPDDDDPEWLWPHNWWRELSGFGAIDDAAALLVATLVEVHGLAAHEPVHLLVFPATNEHYRWESDTGHPCGGQLVPA
jgi:hypothetical protein